MNHGKYCAIIYVMTYPRAHLVDLRNGGHYHCISRCVRQSWLCGVDREKGVSYEHRRDWIKMRVNHLAKIFAVDVYAYAIMSNHYHLVVHLDPKRTEQWTESEVVDRWLSRTTAKGTKSKEIMKERKNSLINQPQKVAEIRARLGSLSWFMREINEPMARIANEEDGCSGRFWEGRFKSIALLDYVALLACMIYVDLNPVRANAQTRLPSKHTSAMERSKRHPDSLATLRKLGTNTQSYLQLLRWSQKKTISTRQSEMKIPGLIKDLGYSDQIWTQWISANSSWYRAYGNTTSLNAYLVKLGQRWIQMPRLRTLLSTADTT